MVDSGGSSDAGHLDELIAADAAAEADAADIAGDGGAAGGLAPGGLLSRDAWCEAVAKTLTAGAAITGLAALQTDLANPVHREGLTALYDSFRDVPQLHFLLRPGGKWMGRAVAIGAWSIPMARGVGAELKERRQAKRRTAASAGAGEGSSPPAGGEDLSTLAGIEAAKEAA